MRKLASIFLKTTDHCNTITSLVRSTQKFSFSVSSNGQSIKNHSHVHILQDPSRIQSLKDTKSFHALTITMGSIPGQKPIFLHNNIIKHYACYGDILSAIKMFDEIPQRNVVTYNTMLSAYCCNGFLELAWELFSCIRHCGFKPTVFTFGGLLSCNALDCVQGMQLHALIEKNGLFYADPFPGTALLRMYENSDWLDEAVLVFETMPEKSLVTWNCMISLFGQRGLVENCIHMLRDLMRSEYKLSESTFVGVLSGFDGADELELGEHVHGVVLKSGFDQVASVCNSLVSMYAKCGYQSSLENMFQGAPIRDIVTWNTIIGSMTKSGRPAKAFDFFLEMCNNGFLPNELTFVYVLNSSSTMQKLFYGELIHAKMIKKRFESDVHAGSSLVDFYAKCNKSQEAHFCFDEITEKNSVSWNALMLGHANGGCSDSVRLLREMIGLGYSPTEYSFSIVIKSSSTFELLQLHSLMTKMGYQENAYVISCLISSYAKNGLISDALTFVTSDNMPCSVVSSNLIAAIYNRTGQYDKTQEIYATVEEPDTISWNILIAACSRNDDYEEVFELFHHMRRSKVYPDNYTYVSLFSVCTKLHNLALGCSLHGLNIKTDFRSCDTFLCNIMIDMYGKCGNLESSIKLFNDMAERNVFSWTALISALALNGHANRSLDKFREMEEKGVLPDKVAFLAVLSACRRVGNVKQAMELFKQMKQKYAIQPEMDHYVILVDLLMRFGHWREAEKLITRMPFPPNALIWRAFLEGGRIQ